MCRLAVMLMLGMPAFAVAEGWRFEKRANPFGGGAIAVAQVENQPVSPLVRCWTNRRELDLRMVITDGAPLPDGEMLELRFDKGPKQRIAWQANSSRLALTAPAERRAALLKGLRLGSELLLYRPQSDGSLVTHRISLKGSSRAIGQVLAACR